VADADLKYVERGPDSYVCHADPVKCSPHRREQAEQSARLRAEELNAKEGA
jgi:hypothetical protein